MNETAHNTEDKVDSELASFLNDLKNRLEVIRGKIHNVSTGLSGIKSNFPVLDDMASDIGKFK